MTTNDNDAEEEGNAKLPHSFDVRIPLLHNWWFVLPLVLLVAALDVHANAHHRTWGDWLATAFFAAYSIYCAQNFARCREPHCAITAPGFFIAALLMLLRVTGSVHYEYVLAWYVFAASALVGHCYEYFASASSSR